MGERDRDTLDGWLRAPTVPQALALRAKIIVSSAAGEGPRAPVLCIDEKSQIRALNRTQPILPLRPGLPARMPHDYTRHGTTSLFAALEVASSKVDGGVFRGTRIRSSWRFSTVSLDEVRSRHPTQAPPC